MALNTRHMIVERHPIAGRMAGQRNGVLGLALQPQQQPPAHLSVLPVQVRCLPPAASGLSGSIEYRSRLTADRNWCANDKTGSLQAGRPAVTLGTVGSKAGRPTTFTVVATGSPEATRG